MKQLAKIIFIPCLCCVCNAHAFPDGVNVGVGVSALSGLNVFAGYTPYNSSSWLGNFGARFDFASTSPLQSALNSAIDRLMRDGIDVGDGVRIDEGVLDSKHYAALVDYYPFRGAWRLSGGYFFGDMNLDASIKGEISNVPTQRFYFYINGDHYYYNGNQFRGSVSIDWEYNGPYLGTGFDINLFCGFQLFVDFGVVFTNRSAKLSLDIPHEQLYIYDTETGTWSPVTVPQLDSDVAAATDDANKKLSDIRVLPVVKMGFSYLF